MGQLVVDAEAAGLHRLGVREHELLGVGGVRLGQIHGSIQHGGGNQLDLVPAQAGGKAEIEGRLAVGPGSELGQHLGLGVAHPARAEDRAGRRVLEPYLGVGQAHLVYGGVDGPVAAHVGIAQGQHPAGIGPAQGLQPLGPGGREQERLAGQVGDLRAGGGVFGPGGHQPVLAVPVGHKRHLLRRKIGGGFRVGGLCIALEPLQPQETVAVVKGGAQDLPAGDVLEGRRDAPHREERLGLDGQGFGGIRCECKEYSHKY